MELLDGMPLDDYLREHRISDQQAWSIIDGACQGLMAAHEADIILSDFKPGNIYYTSNKTVKVFDFGVARQAAASLSSQDKHKLSTDLQSLVSLTPAYASSERDDVFALAVLSYELLSGKHPSDRAPADKVLAKGLEPAIINSIQFQRQDGKHLTKP
jgi:serine/threonine protein kinase